MSKKILRVVQAPPVHALAHHGKTKILGGGTTYSLEKNGEQTLERAGEKKPVRLQGANNEVATLARLENGKQQKIPKVKDSDIVCWGNGAYEKHFVGEPKKIVDKLKEKFPNPTTYSEDKIELKTGHKKYTFYKKMNGTHLVWIAVPEQEVISEKEKELIEKVLELKFRQTIPKVAKNEIVCWGDSAFKHFIEVKEHREKLKTKLPDPQSYSGETVTVKNGKYDYTFSKRLTGNGKLTWVAVPKKTEITKQEKELIENVLEQKFREDIPAYAENEIVCWGRGASKHFVGNPNLIATKLGNKLPEPKTYKGFSYELTKDGLKQIFYKRARSGSLIWVTVPKDKTISKSEKENIEDILDLKFKNDIPPVVENEIICWGQGASNNFVGRDHDLADKLREILPDPGIYDSNEFTLTKDGEEQSFLKRITGGGRMTWVAIPQNEFEKKRLQILLGLELRINPIALIEELKLTDAVALLLGNKDADAQKLQQYLIICHPELGLGEINETIASALEGIKPTCQIPQEVHKNYEVNLKEPSIKIQFPQQNGVYKTKANSFIISGESDSEYVQVTGSYTRKIVVKKDGTFQASIPLPKTGELNDFHIYAFNDEMDETRIAEHIEGLNLPAPTSYSSDDRIIINKNEKQITLYKENDDDNYWTCEQGEVYVLGDILDIPAKNIEHMPIIQEDMIPITPSSLKRVLVGEKSEGIALDIHQTGTKIDSEEALRRLLRIKEGILGEVQKDITRYNFLKRIKEISLLKHFTYDEEKGIEYLKELIRNEESSTLKKLLKEILEKFEKVKDIKLEVKDEGEIRPYFFQKYCVYEALSAMEEGRRGIIISNEQGLGKTLTALWIVNGTKALIITPNPVVTTWTGEEEKLTAEPQLEALEGTYAEREEALEYLDKPQVVINIEFTRGMTEHRAKLLSKFSNILVIDEADYLGSSASQQTKGTEQIPSTFKILLTATPFRSLSGLNNFLKQIYPDSDSGFGAAKVFSRAFSKASQLDLNALAYTMMEHGIRIRKRDVFEEYDPNIPLDEQKDKLPKKVLIYPKDLNTGQFYLAHEQCESMLELFTDYQGWCRKHNKGKLITEEDMEYTRYKEGFFNKREAVRQIANNPRKYLGIDIDSPKHKALDKIVRRELAPFPDKKMVIFCRYRSQVEEYLERYRRYNPVAYYGGLKTNSNGYLLGENNEVLYFKANNYGTPVLYNGEFIRQDKLHGKPIRALDYSRLRFQDDPNCRMIVATYDSGSVGINFTATDVVIFDDLAIYRDQYQAGDRGHRIDNKRKKYEVKYYWLQSLYPKSFLDTLDLKIRETYFDVGTYDQVYFERTMNDGITFHRVMDIVGQSDRNSGESIEDLKRKLPFLFANGENESQEKPEALIAEN